MISVSWLSEFSFADRTSKPDLPEQWHELTGYIKITPDNIIKILCPNPEFGQNVMTSLPMIVAEELDADWQKLVVEMGPHDNVKLGPQFTGGSNSPHVEVAATAALETSDPHLVSQGSPAVSASKGVLLLFADHLVALPGKNPVADLQSVQHAETLHPWFIQRHSAGQRF